MTTTTSTKRRARGRMFLSNYVDRHYLRQRQLAKRYSYYLRRTVAQVEVFCCRKLRLQDVTDELADRWTTDMRVTFDAKTVENYVGYLKAIMRGAFEDYLCEHELYRVARIPLPRTLPAAWNEDDVKRLQRRVGQLPDYFRLNGIKRDAFWTTFLLVAHETPLSLNAVFDLRRSAIDRSGRIRGDDARHVGRLKRSTVKRVDALFPPHDRKRGDRVFWWPMRREKFFGDLRRIHREAGLTAKYGVRLRRTVASRRSKKGGAR